MRKGAAKPRNRISAISRLTTRSPSVSGTPPAYNDTAVRCADAPPRGTHAADFVGVRFVIRFPRGVVVSGSLESAPGWRHGVVYRGADADIGAESDSWPPSNDSYGAHQPIKGGCEASPSHASCRKCTSAAAHPLTYASSITVSAKEPRRSDRDSSSTGPQDQP